MSAEPLARSELEEKRVAITGRLACMSHEHAAAKIVGAGGVFVRQVDASTDYLVIGQEGWPLRKDGRPTRSLQLAQDLRDRGHAIQLLDEAKFLGLLGEEHEESARRLYTSEQLSRILGIPHAEVRSWIRQGLIRPADTVRRLCYFDFEQVTGARALQDLRKSGVSASQLRSSLRQLERWLPQARKGLSQLEIIEEGGRLLLRLEDGSLAEPSGQLQLDFSSVSAESEAATEELPGPRILGVSRDWFEIATQYEEAGELEEAARAYHRALLHGSAEPEVAFNLGNVLFALGRADASSQRFQQAVELDPEYVEAWNNLGNVFSELGFDTDARTAYQEAIRLEPHYADAHYNFGELLFRTGDLERARHHFLEYLRQDPDSAWSRRVRDSLSEIERSAQELERSADQAKEPVD